MVLLCGGGVNPQPCPKILWITSATRSKGHHLTWTVSRLKVIGGGGGEVMDTLCTATTTMFLREQFLAGMLLTVGWISISEIVFKVKATGMSRPGPNTTITNRLFIQCYNLIWLLNHLYQPWKLKTVHVKFTFTWQ